MSTENWVAGGNRAELGEGAMKGIELGDLQIAIYNIEGEIHATDNICTHAFALLTDGFLDGDVVECPLHGGCFKIKTGEGMGAPISEDIKTYPVRLSGDTIEINIG
jgi:nitrite reductase/ring-hydroxylating ferredoxin subunit